MAIFYPQCRNKHPLKECPLNVVETYAICEQNHSTSMCPSLPRLKAVFQGANEETYQLYFMVPKNSWQPRPHNMNIGMNQDPSQYFNNQNFGSQSTSFPPSWSQYYQYPMPWQSRSPQPGPFPSWSQNWRGPPHPTNKLPQPMTQQQLQIPPNTYTSTPLRPQLVVQTNTNPNNRGVQQDETLSLPAYGIATSQFNELNFDPYEW